MKATPRITVRIDRGEDFVELCGDWQDFYPPMCGEGNLGDWLDTTKMYEALHKLNEAVMEKLTKKGGTMITKERYEMLKEANRKGANLAPVDYEAIREYEKSLKGEK